MNRYLTVVLVTAPSVGLTHGLPQGTNHEHSASVEMAGGAVFLDRNGNGVRDWGERGIARVNVSNGIDVVQTDSRGL